MLPRDTRTLRRSLHLIRKRKIFLHVRCNFYEKEKKNLVWHFMGPQLVRSYIADIEMLLKSLHIIFSTIKKNREKEGEMKTTRQHILVHVSSCQWHQQSCPTKNLHLFLVSFIGSLYGFRVNSSCSRGCFQCCKVFVTGAFHRRRSFTQLNESDFGFQTVFASCVGVVWETRGNGDRYIQ